MNELTSTAIPGIYTAAGDDTVAIIEITESQTIAWLLHEVADDDDGSCPEAEWPGGPILDLQLTVGERGILHGAGTIGDAELGVIVNITKLNARVA
ncbi:hypothetical protein [Cryobacterium sp. GrIS_2_6]|uniref:hypothetical protein n=1 Tax=Cryobacterium sp. GrIS_2_6 TaxID=3162785 RepID=UPI002E01B420|nr:hypothetical protein [Cryobacterium psychrotolerans]